MTPQLCGDCHTSSVNFSPQGGCTQDHYTAVELLYQSVDDWCKLRSHWTPACTRENRVQVRAFRSINVLARVGLCCIKQQDDPVCVQGGVTTLCLHSLKRLGSTERNLKKKKKKGTTLNKRAERSTAACAGIQEHVCLSLLPLTEDLCQRRHPVMFFWPPAAMWNPPSRADTWVVSHPDADLSAAASALGGRRLLIGNSKLSDRRCRWSFWASVVHSKPGILSFIDMDSNKSRDSSCCLVASSSALFSPKLSVTVFMGAFSSFFVKADLLHQLRLYVFLWSPEHHTEETSSRQEVHWEVENTYTSVCADVHFQAIVFAECFVTVGTLVGTLTWETKAMRKWEVIQVRGVCVHF